MYIQGYKVKCDLLIVKQNSKPICGEPSIYRAKDVPAIIESKATGIFIDKKNPKKPVLKRAKYYIKHLCL